MTKVFLQTTILQSLIFLFWLAYRKNRVLLCNTIEELVRIGQEGVPMHGGMVLKNHSLTVLGYLIYHLPTNPPREDLFSEGWKGLLVDLGQPLLYCEGIG